MISHAHTAPVLLHVRFLSQGGVLATPATAGPPRHCFVVDSQAVVAPTSVVRPHTALLIANLHHLWSVQITVCLSVECPHHRPPLQELVTAPLLHMALQRCRDDRGPVRKAGLVLLEALLLVRHKADRTVMPDAASLAAIADAARDHLVCVVV